MWGEVKNNMLTTCQKEAMGHRDKTKKRALRKCTEISRSLKMRCRQKVFVTEMGMFVPSFVSDYLFTQSVFTVQILGIF